MVHIGDCSVSYIVVRVVVRIRLLTIYILSLIGKNYFIYTGMGEPTVIIIVQKSATIT